MYVSLFPSLFRFLLGLTPAKYQPNSQSCNTRKSEYHTFLSDTAHLLSAIARRQAMFQWDGESGVHGKLVWMQGLWASRKPVSQFLHLL
jgi:hypothetical protein